MRLEAGRGAQIGADGGVFGRRHGGQHVPGVHQLVHDARHPRQHLEGGRQFAAAEVAAHGVQFVQHQFQPQLAGLVLDDEQQLVVIGRAGVLGVQDLVQAQVIAIAHRFGEIELGAVPCRFFFVAHTIFQVTAPRAAWRRRLCVEDVTQDFHRIPDVRVTCIQWGEAEAHQGRLAVVADHAPLDQGLHDGVTVGMGKADMAAPARMLARRGQGQGMGAAAALHQFNEQVGQGQRFFAQGGDTCLLK